MLYFLENHDEQRVASDYFAGNAKCGIPALIVSTLMQKNPFMLYAGEEFGEKGMDSEGFSGVDGRTTIFDYWCVDTLRRGYFSRKELTKEEIYFLTKAQDVQKMSEAVDQILDLTAWCIYLDTNADDQEVELFSMRTEDGDTFATNSATFIRAFREILDIFEPSEVKRLKVMNGVSKNNRTFITCAYVSPVEE